ncbi:hypothetical protein [Leptospira kanakyensis]|uniref:hypothetical protein n=1 Tax=Leptospira kanakyensis TaxID=2484968 RepID=UPI00223DB76A|nr:hypothetical protein [Leptospira kanakyensis]MCW7483231.1 hypothetical protein [Leptospira kanakyensis]
MTNKHNEAHAEKCLRGLRNSDCISDNVITAAAFLPKSNFQSNRNPPVKEISINHFDSSESLEILKKDKSNSEFGIISFPSNITTTIINLNPQILDASKLYIERQPITGNQYHGNIIYDMQIPHARIKLYAAIIATVSELIK